MPADQLVLRPLTIEDEATFREAVREFAATDPAMDFAFQFPPSVRFNDYVAMVNSWPEGRSLPSGFVPSTFLVGVVAGTVVGRVSLRYRLNDYLRRIGGHIGYCVIPSQRQRGYAKEMLRQSLRLAKAVGIERVLVTCDTDNPASLRVIRANGGVFENTTCEPELKVQKHRYWIYV